MAKKAPAKKAPAKRKPRAKKPVQPKPLVDELQIIKPVPEEIISFNAGQVLTGGYLRKRLNLNGQIETYSLAPIETKPAKQETPPNSVTIIDPIAKSSSLWRRLLFGGAVVAGLVVYTAIVIWLCGGIQVGPKPVDPVPVVPDPVTSFRVIFVKESGQTLQGEQLAIPGAKEIREFLATKTTQENGLPGWREYDPQQQTSNESPTMKALWEAVKPKLLPAPCLVIEVNGKATVMPFPATVADAVATLKKAGG